MGLSTKTGSPASTKGRARDTWPSPSSVEMMTASTLPMTSSGLATMCSIKLARATGSASSGWSVHRCVTLAPGMRTDSSGCLPR